MTMHHGKIECPRPYFLRERCSRDTVNIVFQFVRKEWVWEVQQLLRRLGNPGAIR